MDRLRDYSPRGRSMSISPEMYRRDSPDYRHRSRSCSRSPNYRRHNGYRSPTYHKKTYHHEYIDERRGESDYDSDREYRRDREHSWEVERERKSRSRSPDYRERDRDRGNRYYRNRDRDHHRLRRRSRSGSRWERKSEDRKVRDRERYRDDDRDSDSERSPNGAVIGASGSEIIGYKSQPPNNTIMIRGLAQHITENDIRQDIIQCGLMPKDIRLIRKKDTGASRGFAFVEFATLGEAIRWMDIKQGVLMLQDQYRAIMQYSIPKDMNSSEKPPTHKASADWFCIKCGAQNFKRRDNCFKCHASRMESEEGGSGSDEICSYATKTIMMRNLDALTTEDSVMAVLNSIIPDLVKSISAVCIGRDPLTSTSRGICYLGTESTIDALAIYGALNSSKTPLTIDGKTVILSYCKYNMGDTKKAYSQADHAAFPNASIPSTYAMTDVDSLAEYAARRYAKTPQEYMHYIEYYRGFFTQQISAGNSITLHQENQMDAANAAAAVAQSAIQQMNANKSYYDNTHIVVPNGTDGKKYQKQDKVKVAKKIAKDMERWAKTLNQKKETSNFKTTADSNICSSSASADIGFSVLEKKSVALVTAPPAPFFKQEVMEEPPTPSALPLVAAYGGESESSGDEEIEDLLDYNRLICNLCKRQLGSAEALTKHAKLSTLHKQNLETRRKKKQENVKEKIVYRDRAKERRMKYGDPDEPQPSKLKEKYLKSREMDIPVPSSSVSEPIGSENAEQHSSTVGLGNKLPGYTALAGESYKDCVKKMMYARYQELTEKENSN
ncbi:hypothetical protein NQ314_016290 [Rhamnusium bicolor]|uniref:RNA-binding protein 5 n=1 Tax=Rhamnusium bicolor TaxID=1586634 RepID=A0AAV8WXB0_9CUCU|nr:hypothetical protein NQ314_016290 [Rhamnusium bicolor]